MQGKGGRVGCRGYLVRWCRPEKRKIGEFGNNKIARKIA